MEFFKVCFLGASLLLASCVTRYHEPMSLSDDEIESMVVRDQFTDNGTASPGRIRACNSIFANEQGCAIIVCKKDETRRSKLKCDLYSPKRRE